MEISNSSKQWLTFSNESAIWNSFEDHRFSFPRSRGSGRKRMRVGTTWFSCFRSPFYSREHWPRVEHVPPIIIQRQWIGSFLETFFFVRGDFIRCRLHRDSTVFQFFRIPTTLSDESLFVSSFVCVCVCTTCLSVSTFYSIFIGWATRRLALFSSNKLQQREREREREICYRWWETLRESALIFIADVPNPEQPLLFSSGRDSFIDIRGAPFLSRFSRVETSSCSLYGVITRASG